MNRRTFIKRGALFVPAIFIPRLIRAQSVLTAPGAALIAKKKAASAGGGGGSDTPFVTAVNSLDGSFVISQETGMSVLMSSTVTATKLGRYVHSGDGSSLPINLYNSSGTLLQTVNVNTTGQTVGTFVYGSISPTTLSSGQRYYILVAFDGVTDHWSNNGTSITTTAVATPTYGDRISGSVATHAGQTTGPVNFIYH